MSMSGSFAGSSGPGGTPLQGPQVNQQVLAGAQHASIGSLSITNQGGNYTSIINNYQDSSEPSPRFSRDDIVNWLKAPNFRPIQQTAIAQRMLDTGTWFIQSAEFQQLMNVDGYQLWGTGMPGSGKTVLSAISVGYLEKTHRGQEDIGLSFAFLRYNERHTTRDIFAALLSQLVNGNCTAYSIAEAMYARARMAGADPVQEDLVGSLTDICRALSRLFVVLDGLDEAADDVKDELLRVLPPIGANLLITSRPLPLFVHHMPYAHYVKIQARTEDIAVFVREQIRRNARLRELLRDKPELITKLSSRVKESSQGMFLVARLQMEVVIRKAINVNSIFKALDQLPSGVDQMYEHTLNRIKAQSSEDEAIAWRAFVWLLHAREPLTIRQVQIALCISFEKESFDPDDEIPVATILSICGGLVTVEKRGPKEHFRFIHYTTREYLEKVQLPQTWDPHTILSVSCIIYLEEHHIHESISEVADRDIRDFKKAIRFGDLNKRYHLWYYALYNWGPHAAQSQNQRPLHPYLMAFLSRYYRHFWQWPNSNLDSGGTAFRFALRFGLSGVIESKAFPLDLGKGSLTELHSAARRGDSELFKALLSSHVMDVMRHRDASGETFLHDAVRYTQTQFIRSLLSRNDDPAGSNAQRAAWKANLKHCNINATNRAGETPFILACQQDLEELVHIIGSHNDCQTNHCDALGQTALFYACSSRNKASSLPSTLIESFPGIDPSIGNLKRETPFMMACESGQTHTVRFLLGRDKSYAHAKDHNGRTPLMRLFDNSAGCTASSIPAIFELLLEYGSSLHARDRNGLSPFLHAVQSAGRDFEGGPLQHCIERMCTVDPSVISHHDVDGHTGLMIAAKGCGLDVVSNKLVQFILAQPMVDFTYMAEKDITGRTAFLAAFGDGSSGTRVLHELAAKGDCEFLDALHLLPSRWEDLPRTKAGDSLLHLSVMHGHIQLTKGLLSVYDAFLDLEGCSSEVGKQECWINSQNNAGHTPLILACQNHDLAAIGIIALQQRCDPNIVDLQGRTAMFYACSSWSRWTQDTHLLLAQLFPTIDVDTRDSRGSTPFMGACELGQENVVRWFLKRDPAKVHEVDESGRTPLMRLFTHSSLPSFAVFDMLLNGGSDLHVCDQRGNTTFLHAVGNDPREGRTLRYLQRICQTDPTVVNQHNNSGETVLMIALAKTDIYRTLGGGHSVVPFLLSCPNLHCHLLEVRGDLPKIEAQPVVIGAPESDVLASYWKNIRWRLHLFQGLLDEVLRQRSPSGIPSIAITSQSDPDSSDEFAHETRPL